MVPANQVQLYKSGKSDAKPILRKTVKQKDAREETGGQSDTVEEHFQVVEHEISGEMAQPRKSYWNKQALQNVKKFQLLKNLSEAKLDYS